MSKWEKEVEKILQKEDFIDQGIKAIENNSTIPQKIKEALLQRETWETGWEYLQNAQWFNERYKALQEQHPGKQVIVYEQELLLASANHEEISEKIKSLGPDKAKCFIDYVCKPGEKLLYLAATWLILPFPVFLC